MRTRWAIIAGWFLAIPATAGEGPTRATASPTSQESAFFERRVRPVLVENCVPCHGPAKQKSGSAPRLAVGPDQGEWRRADGGAG